jgi:hypothetical protein
MVPKFKIFLGRFYEYAFRTKHSMLVDTLFLASLAAVVLEALGLLTNPTPVGDDALVHIKKIVDLAESFLQFQWDPRSFNGYRPSTGYAWASYGPPAEFVSLGLDPTIVFHLTFVSYFVLIGPSIYYFARTVGTRRIVAIAVSVLGWSTTGYWGYVGGGAYSRVFTLPFIFTALALTYRYVTLQNHGRPDRRTYWLLLLVWFLTFLGDVYIGIVPVLVAIPFILVSAGPRNLRFGLRRLAAVLLPVLALTSWFWIPLASHALAVGSPPSDLTVSTASQIFWLGPLSSIVAVLARKKFSDQRLGPEHAAILISLNLVSIYFLIMGAITPLWPYLPRIWATYDSFNILSFLFPLTLACLFVWLKPLRRGTIVRQLAIALIILVVVNASITINESRPPDRTTLNNALDQALQGNFVASDNYRISLQGRTSTRWFPSFYPEVSQTGGRVLGLNPNPFYQSWYQTEVFFKDDLGTLNNVYLEDQPTIDVTGLVGAPQNFASTTYWLDWYGVGTVILDPAFYPVQNTGQGFSERGSLFSTKTVQTGYGPLLFVTPTDLSPVLVGTNASTIGFYSQQPDSANRYHALLALFSYLGLDSRYVVPIYLSSLDNISPQMFGAIVTDQNTYSTTGARINTLEAQGTRFVVLGPDLLTQLQNLGPRGAYDLISLISPAITVQAQNVTTVSAFQSKTLTLSPQQWTAGHSKNADGQLQTSQNNLTLILNIPDITKTSQFNLDANLTSPMVLSDKLITNISLDSNAQANVGLAFTSNNFTSTAVASNITLTSGQTADFHVPYTNFTQSEFSLATGLVLSITVPPGQQNAIVHLTGASLNEADYSIYTPSQSISMSTAGLLQGLFSPGGTIILSDEKGDMVGAYPSKNIQSGETIIPLRAFTSRSNQGFTRILSVGGTTQPIVVDLIQQSSWIPVGIRWTTKQTLKSQNVSAGFRGLVWKETFTSDWSIQGNNLSGTATSLPYFFAGPGMVYIPLNGFSFANVSISYQNILYSLILPLASTLFLVPLLLFRKRVYQFGTIRTLS